MKLWPTTTENKYFVKILGHLLVQYFCTVATVTSDTVATVPNFFFKWFVCVFFFLLNIYVNIYVSW